MSSHEPALPAAPQVRGHDAIVSLVPFGWGQDKPHDYLEAAGLLWENRDRPLYSWRILRDAACDGCALGARGLRDDVSGGLHLCNRRLQGLRRLTGPSLVPADLLDLGHLRDLDPEARIDLGRLGYPFLHRRGERGFTKISAAEWLAGFKDSVGR